MLSLEEIENSAKYDGPENRDVALATLVTALNADAGAGPCGRSCPRRPWPTSRRSPTQDVIRTAFIYKNAKAEPVGPSYVLTGSDPFAARVSRWVRCSSRWGAPSRRSSSRS